jgi:pimeloyl-ACP methyl ester carboxylesterase
MLVYSLVVFLILGTCYLAICGVIAHSMLKPHRKLPPAPADVGFPDAKGVSFQSQDGITLKGYSLRSSGDRAVVLVHGVHSHCWDVHAPEIARALLDAGFAVLVFDLRAHGRSGGDRLGLGRLERQDVAAAVEFLLSVDIAGLRARRRRATEQWQTIANA